MLKCPKCGADNLMTAVFCRQCGEKIPLDELKPDEIDKANVEKKAGKANTTVGIGLLVIILAILGAALLPMGSNFASGDEAAISAAVTKIIQGKTNATFDLTNSDASLYLTKKLSESGNNDIQKVGIAFAAPNKASIFARGKFHGIPATLVIKGTLSVSDKRIAFTAEKSGLGLICLPYFNDLPELKAACSFVSEALKKDLRKIKELSCEDGTLKLTRTSKAAK